MFLLSTTKKWSCSCTRYLEDLVKIFKKIFVRSYSLEDLKKEMGLDFHGFIAAIAAIIFAKISTNASKKNEISHATTFYCLFHLIN